MLDILKDYFEIILFSLGEADYVNKAANLLDPNKEIFSYILTREDARPSSKSNLNFMKDITLLNDGRSEASIIVVDNLPEVVV